MDQSPLMRLAGEKYVLVTTYRKDGRAVATPVWVVRDGDALGVWTAADSGKVKRVRNRADVLVAPCDMRGNPTGEALPGTAELCSAEDTGAYRTLIRSKYGLMGTLTLFGSRLRRGDQGTVGIRIRLDESAGRLEEAPGGAEGPA
ncbi:PPOX class F420-dependent oxidoreductase [Actinocorallia aurantiaca]|uniref:PPOX class F420-dependent oxidoreductase n=1 Tax=Actinocorallia aurantiaca TaxID=46204 RepID=A0ABN3UDK7_9ACTN